MSKTVADVLWEMLAKAGVKRCYGIVGDALNPVVDALVNTARGGLVVDDDLIAALKSGRVAAAGLDVFEGEPKLHPEYASLKNTFLLPHIGSATIETRSAMGMLALDNVEAVLNGRPAPTLIQP